jgi:hypothetical protein
MKLSPHWWVMSVRDPPRPNLSFNRSRRPYLFVVAERQAKA